METALAWNAVKKTLSEVGKDELFGHTQGIRVTEKYIIIKTRKPIVNAELRLYSEEISKRFQITGKPIGIR